jgi:hypothetical protein
MNSGAYPPNYDTDVGRVRLLISDTTATNILGSEPDQTGDYLWHGDTEIEALVSMTGSAERAAIRILRLVAMTPAMQLKKWSSADLSVDGPAITRALRELINDIEVSLDAGTKIAINDLALIVATGAADCMGGRRRAIAHHELGPGSGRHGPRGSRRCARKATSVQLRRRRDRREDGRGSPQQACRGRLRSTPGA